MIITDRELDLAPIMDADWEPSAPDYEPPTRMTDPVLYHQRCLRRWARQNIRRGRLLRKCLTAAVLLFAASVVLALLVGGAA